MPYRHLHSFTSRHPANLVTQVICNRLAWIENQDIQQSDGISLTGERAARAADDRQHGK
jgi:hypothetical protein